MTISKAFPHLIRVGTTAALLLLGAMPSCLTTQRGDTADGTRKANPGTETAESELGEYDDANEVETVPTDVIARNAACRPGRCVVRCEGLPADSGGRPGVFCQPFATLGDPKLGEAPLTEPLPSDVTLQWNQPRTTDNSPLPNYTIDRAGVEGRVFRFDPPDRQITVRVGFRIQDATSVAAPETEFLLSFMVTTIGLVPQLPVSFQSAVDPEDNTPRVAGFVPRTMNSQMEYLGTLESIARHSDRLFFSAGAFIYELRLAETSKTTSRFFVYAGNVNASTASLASRQAVGFLGDAESASLVLGTLPPQTSTGKATLLAYSSGTRMIYRIRDTGPVEVLAGQVTPTSDCPSADGDVTKVALPKEITSLNGDSKGNIYIAAPECHRVYRLSNGRLSSFVGTGSMPGNSFSDWDPGSVDPKFLKLIEPAWVAVTTDGSRLYIAERRKNHKNSESRRLIYVEPHATPSVRARVALFMRDHNLPQGLAVSDDRVYWTNSDTGYPEVMEWAFGTNSRRTALTREPFPSPRPNQLGAVAVDRDENHIFVLGRGDNGGLFAARRYGPREPVIYENHLSNPVRVGSSQDRDQWLRHVSSIGNVEGLDFDLNGNVILADKGRKEVRIAHRNSDGSYDSPRWLFGSAREGTKPREKLQVPGVSWLSVRSPGRAWVLSTSPERPVLQHVSHYGSDEDFKALYMLTFAHLRPGAAPPRWLGPAKFNLEDIADRDLHAIHTMAATGDRLYFHEKGAPYVRRLYWETRGDDRWVMDSPVNAPTVEGLHSMSWGTHDNRLYFTDPPTGSIWASAIESADPRPTRVATGLAPLGKGPELLTLDAEGVIYFTSHMGRKLHVLTPRPATPSQYQHAVIFGTDLQEICGTGVIRGTARPGQALATRLEVGLRSVCQGQITALTARSFCEPGSRINQRLVAFAQRFPAANSSTMIVVASLPCPED